MRMIDKNAKQRISDWSKILELLEQGEPSSEQNKRLIEVMLQKRLEHDTAKQAAAAERERKDKERDEFCKLVLFQFKQAIVEPLEEFISDFNQQYSGVSAVISSSADGLSGRFNVSMPSGGSIAGQFYVLLEETFRRRVRRQDMFGDVFERQEIQIPHYRGRRIQGWAVIEASDRRGLNLILVEQEGQIYGEWFMLINTSGMLSSGLDRPEPFAFSFNELEEGVSLIGVISRYQVQAKPLDLAYIKEFIANHA
jgi:hypothetical protein